MRAPSRAVKIRARNTETALLLNFKSFALLSRRISPRARIRHVARGHYLSTFLLLEGNEVLADSNKQGVAGWRYFATKVMDCGEIVRRGANSQTTLLKFDSRRARRINLARGKREKRGNPCVPLSIRCWWGTFLNFLKVQLCFMSSRTLLDYFLLPPWWELKIDWTRNAKIQVLPR